jgi:hypothetical protein
MTKCNRCPKEAEFDSPEDLCGECWAEWWVSNEDTKTSLTAQERQVYYEETMLAIREMRESDG